MQDLIQMYDALLHPILLAASHGEKEIQATFFGNSQLFTPSPATMDRHWPRGC
jgi:hypothetical protein